MFFLYFLHHFCKNSILKIKTLKAMWALLDWYLARPVPFFDVPRVEHSLKYDEKS
jgi:hypothetical protein